MLPTSRERSKVNQAVAKTGKMRDTVQRSRQQAYHKALGRLGPPALICALHYCFSSSTRLTDCIPAVPDASPAEAGAS